METRKPTAEQMRKKLKLSLDLFAAAFEIKKHQLERKFPQKSQEEINQMTLALFYKANQ